jgi:hypothetical protein
MGKILVQEVTTSLKLYRDERTGVAWVEDLEGNLVLTPHPFIGKGDSIRTMKLRGIWKRDCRTAASHGLIHNISWCRTDLDNPLDVLAMRACRCGGVHHEQREEGSHGGEEKAAPIGAAA